MMIQDEKQQFLKEGQGVSVFEPAKRVRVRKLGGFSKRSRQHKTATKPPDSAAKTDVLGHIL